MAFRAFVGLIFFAVIPTAGRIAPPAPALAQSGPPSAKVALTPEQLREMPISGSCVTDACHDRFTAFSFKHGPVIENACEPCHTPLAGKHDFDKMPETKYLCRACHQPYPPRKARHLDADEFCQGCHDPHGGNERFFLKSGSASALCMECHAEHVGEEPRHDPVAKGSCLACHELHHAEAKPLLRAPRGRICLRCHDDKAKGLEGSASVHKPAKEACTNCHAPHGRADRLIKAEVMDLCRECHADMLDYATKAKFPHKAVMEGKHCIACHNPHFSRGRKLLKAPTRDLCVSCHDRTYELPDGSVLADVKTQLVESRHIHGPARQGSCTPCHNPHGSNYPRLLNFDFPCSFYAPFESSRYDLCFRCHDRRIVLEPESTVTRFRNGRRNLHFLHVNQEKKGRTCRACHHEHASNNPLQVRETVPFGKWTMTITFRKKSEGGSCQSGCHVEYGYDRVEPVRNITEGTEPTFPPERETEEDNPARPNAAARTLEKPLGRLE